MDLKVKPQAVKNRVIELITVRAGDLLDHEGNWRIHPLYQREAVEGRLEDTGITDVLKVYKSKRNGGKLTLVDGHLRKNIDPDIVWPAIVLDIDDDEADEDLAFGDAITGWAEANPLALQSLLEKAKTQNEKAQEANRRLQEQIADQVAIARRALGQEEKPASESLIHNYNLAPSVKVTIAIGDDLATVEQALKATGLKNRGAALGMICNYFLRMHDGGQNHPEG